MDMGIVLLQSLSQICKKLSSRGYKASYGLSGGYYLFVSNDAVEEATQEIKLIGGEVALSEPLEDRTILWVNSRLEY